MISLASPANHVLHSLVLCINLYQFLQGNIFFVFSNLVAKLVCDKETEIRLYVHMQGRFVWNKDLKIIYVR
jgi:hypothetical protein